MKSDQWRFFIALLPPQEIQEYINEIKQIFVDRYSSRAALKSPPHITLQPPFKWMGENLPQLHQTLNEFAALFPPIPIQLSGFGAFAPRVIFINAQKTPALLSLQSSLMAHLEQALGIADPVAQTRPFAPHMTVGFRDLTKQNFHRAWAEFQSLPVEFEFTATSLDLLVHDGQRWNVQQEFPLIGEE